MSIDPRNILAAAGLGEVTQVVAIHGGLSGAATHAVTTSSGAFVLKVHADRTLFRRATAANRLAADAGIAPPLVFFDDAHAASVSVKIEGVPLGVALADPDVRAPALADVVQRIRALHALRVPADLALAETRPLALQIWRTQAARPGFPRWALGLGPGLARAIGRLASDRREVFSHGDLHSNNILWDGRRTWFIDWERAGPEHPYTDLATLATFLDLPEAAALGLLAAYDAHDAHDARATTDADAHAVFRAARERSRICYGAMFLALVPDLTAVVLGDRDETSTLAECYRRMGEGTLHLGTAEGHAAVGAALLRG
jgi:aminoglycoside phosphotransferase